MFLAVSDNDIDCFFDLLLMYQLFNYKHGHANLLIIINYNLLKLHLWILCNIKRATSNKWFSQVSKLKISLYFPVYKMALEFCIIILCESWNQQFQKLLGYNHPTVWVAIEAFRKDHSVVETALFNNANGVPPKKRVKKSTTELQERLQNLCTDYVDMIKGMEEFLRAVGRTIRWKV